MAYTGLVPHPPGKEYGIAVRFPGQVPNTERWFATAAERLKWQASAKARRAVVIGYYDPQVGVRTGGSK